MESCLDIVGMMKGWGEGGRLEGEVPQILGNGLCFRWCIVLVLWEGGSGMDA